MAILEPIFNETVWMPLWLEGADALGAAGDTDGAQTQNGSIDTPALKPPENPFKALMKKIDALAESDNPHDLRNALYMVHGALDDKQYSCDQEHLMLTDRWFALTDKLAPHRPEPISFDPALKAA